MSKDCAIAERHAIASSSPIRVLDAAEGCDGNIRLLPAYRSNRRRRQNSHDNSKSLTSDNLTHELCLLLTNDADMTFHAGTNTDTQASVVDNDCTVIAVADQQDLHVPDALDRKLNSQSPTDQYKLCVTSSSRHHDGPPRFWTPLLERHRKNTRPAASASMFDFQSVEPPDFLYKSSPSPASSTSESAEDRVTSRKKSLIARNCTRQLCCEYFRKFVAFLFSTIGSCCLMVGYVILGGLIFRQLEAVHGRTVDVNMKNVKYKHVSWLWNLTATMNVLHPHDWSTAAFDVINSYTTEVVSATKDYNWDGKNKLEEQWTFTGALLYSITVITTIGLSLVLLVDRRVIIIQILTDAEGNIETL